MSPSNVPTVAELGQMRAGRVRAVYFTAVNLTALVVGLLLDHLALLVVAGVLAAFGAACSVIAHWLFVVGWSVARADATARPKTNAATT